MAKIIHGSDGSSIIVNDDFPEDVDPTKLFDNKQKPEFIAINSKLLLGFGVLNCQLESITINNKQHQIICSSLCSLEFKESVIELLASNRNTFELIVGGFSFGKCELIKVKINDSCKLTFHRLFNIAKENIDD